MISQPVLTVEYSKLGEVRAMSFLFTSNSLWLAQSRYSINTFEWISERITSVKIFTLTLYKNYFYQCHQSPTLLNPAVHSRSSSFQFISRFDKVWGLHPSPLLTLFQSLFLLSLLLLELWMSESLRIQVVGFFILHLTASDNTTNFQISVCSLDHLPEFQTIQSLTDNSTGTAPQTSHTQTRTPIPTTPAPNLLHLHSSPFQLMVFPSSRCSVTHCSYCHHSWRCHQEKWRSPSS